MRYFCSLGGTLPIRLEVLPPLENRNVPSSSGDYQQISHMYNDIHFAVPLANQMRVMTPMDPTEQDRYQHTSFPGHLQLNGVPYSERGPPLSFHRSDGPPVFRHGNSYPEFQQSYHRGRSMHSERRPPQYPRGRMGSESLEGRGQRGRGVPYRGPAPLP